MKTKLTAALAILCCTASIAPIAQADNYPSEPVKIVVPYSPGGSVDTLSREIGKILGDELGQTFIIENRSGASANIGAAYVAKSKPDGYTLFMSAATTLAAAPSIFKNLTYDPRHDLVPVALITSQPNVVVVNPSVKANSLAELIELAKASPGKLNMGIAAVGGPAHMAGELFMLMTKTKMAVIPYRGGADAVMDLLGGRVDVIFAPFPEVISHIQAKKLRPLAVTTKNRTALLPEIPSVNEEGLTGYELIGWMGLAAPKGTPPARITRINAAVQEALKNPSLKRKLNSLGLETLGGTPEEFKTFIDSEVAKYQRLVKASGIEPL